MKWIVFPLALVAHFLLKAQILDVTPAFPNQNDFVTIVYDASLGNGALQNSSTIYAHTGVITNQSTSPTDWKFVKGNWGTADPSVLMTSLGNNLFQISFNIAQFYNFPPNTVVYKLAFVFRNATGSIVGRNADGSDIFYDVYPANSVLLGKIFAPDTYILQNPGMTTKILAKSNESANLILENLTTGQVIAQNPNASLLQHQFTPNNPGEYWIRFTATTANASVSDSVYILVNDNPVIENPPFGLLQGLNRVSPDSVVFKLFAPHKSNIYLIGDFNNWLPSASYQLKLSEDQAKWWLGVAGLQEGVRYGYQYLIDGQPFADPLSELIADPWNDHAIPAYAYPNPYPYPTGKTTGFISLFETNPAPFNWQHADYQRPEKTKLIIYELLVRDFIAKHDYLTLIDTLDYLQNLGVNAIELMPINEFENNESWGYNPSFHMALDKYYGTPEHFKMFVDACHARGIAVIQDVVLNHAFGQSPMVRMYWDAANNRPAENSPWFNQTCPHPPFCWGYDFNHEAQATKDYIDRVNLYWLNEYKVDGFRFDFTKGFVNANANFSQTRIDILKRMADTIWAVHPQAYIILEHFCDNNEEKILADYGMMIWGNITADYHNAHKGFNSSLSWGLHTSRNWNQPHLISYIESHDEQRTMYEARTFGNSTNTSHDVKDFHIALYRAQTTAVIYLLAPGPKMIWQFGELGYDIDINFPCRVCNKPILWNYFFNVYRRQLYDVYAATIRLRQDYPTFTEGTMAHSLGTFNKRFIYSHPDMDAVVVTNFSVTSTNPTAGFTQTGWWYEYYSGDSLWVENVNQQVALNPGDYRVYTTVRLHKPTITSTLDVNDLLDFEIISSVYPNPSNTSFSLQLGQLVIPEKVYILQLDGSIVKEIDPNQIMSPIDISDLSAGRYFVYVEVAHKFSIKPLIKN